ncbi:chitin synthase chs-2 [Pelomyxa schiedti]|nr:chitin synthase chs-2 [Pelomyxa schiedti]
MGRCTEGAFVYARRVLLKIVVAVVLMLTTTSMLVCHKLAILALCSLAAGKEGFHVGGMMTLSGSGPVLSLIASLFQIKRRTFSDYSFKHSIRASLEGSVEAISCSFFIVGVMVAAEEDSDGGGFILMSALSSSSLVPSFSACVISLVRRIGQCNPAHTWQDSLLFGTHLLGFVIQISGIVLMSVKSTIPWILPIHFLLVSASQWGALVTWGSRNSSGNPIFQEQAGHLYNLAHQGSKICVLSMAIPFLHWMFYQDIPVFKLNKDVGLCIIVAGVCAVFSTLLCWVACKARMQIFCFSIPILLCAPLSFFAFVGLCLLPNILPSITFNCPSFYELAQFIGPGLLFFGSAISTGELLCQYLPPLVSNSASCEQILNKPYYCSIGVEPITVLNRCNTRTVLKDNSNGDSSSQQMESGDCNKISNPFYVYVCVPLYHETEEEMSCALKSLTQLYFSDLHCEAHVMFDNSLLDNGDPNTFAQQFIALAAKLSVSPPSTKSTEYGKCTTFFLREGLPFFIHFKDSRIVKRNKRFSQILFFYILQTRRCKQKNENSFLLMVDGDTRYGKRSVRKLCLLLQSDSTCAAVCGRVFPIGSGLLASYQKFEYASGHWLQKSAEDILGTVLCSPGCFTLMKTAALFGSENSVSEQYSSDALTAVDALTHDQGEDRWLSTLLIKTGWRIRYCSVAKAKTFCPTTFKEFFQQRRRWITSTLFNLALVLANGREIIKKNDSAGWLYLLYTAVLLLCAILGPATTIIIFITVSYYAFDLPFFVAIIVGVAPVTVWCFMALISRASKKPSIQIWCSAAFCALYSVGVASLLAGTAYKVTLDAHGFSINIGIVCCVVLIVTTVAAAALHGETLSLVTGGIIYLFLMPFMSCILVIYAIFNMHETSWGTRDVSKQQLCDPSSSLAGVNISPRNMTETDSTYCAAQANECMNFNMEGDQAQESVSSGDDLASFSDCSEKSRLSGDIPVPDSLTGEIEATFSLPNSLSPKPNGIPPSPHEKMALLQILTVATFGIFGALWVSSACIATLYAKKSGGTRGWGVLGDDGQMCWACLVPLITAGFGSALILLQLLALICHRVSTLLLVLATTPLIPCLYPGQL